MNLAQDLLELLCLDGRNRIAEDGAGHVLGNELDGLLRQVGVNYASCGVLDNVQALLDALRGDILVNLHVIDGFLHLTVLVHDKEVGRSGSARHGNRSVNINTAVQAALLELASTIVLAKSGEQTNVTLEKGQVVGNISANTTKGHGNFARVGISRYKGSAWTASNIHVGGTNHNKVGTLAQNVAAAQNCALCGKVGDVNRNRRTRDTCTLCNFLLSNGRLLFNPVENHLFSIGEHQAS